MSIFGLFLLIVFFLFIVRPIYKVWRTYSKIRKGDLSGFADIFGQPGSQKGDSSLNPDGSRKAGWTRPRIRKKKIPSGMGEYVKFTEIETTETASTAETAEGTSRQTDFTVEQQITDVEWEDVK